MNHRLLTLCYTLAEDEVVRPILAYFTEQGYRASYRRYYPRLVSADIVAYDAITIVNATNWQAARYAITKAEIERLAQFVREGGLLLLATSTASEYYHNPTNVDSFNELLRLLDIPIIIHYNQVKDPINSYAGTIRQMPYQRSVPGHRLHPDGYEKLTLGPTNTLTVGEGVDVLLTTDETAEGGIAPTAAIGRAGKGYLCALNAEVYLCMGIGVISPPLIETRRLAQARACVGKLTAYLHGLRIGEIAWQPPPSHLSPFPSPLGEGCEGRDGEAERGATSLRQRIPESVTVSENFLKPSEIFGNIAESGDNAFEPYRPRWRNEVDTAIYGWIEREKIRGGWCYIATGDRAYRKRLVQMAKDARLNLFWGVTNSHLEFQKGTPNQADFIRLAEDITTELDPLWEERGAHQPKIGWFMGFQFPNMIVARAAHLHTAQLDGVERDNPSPVDVGYWERHIFPWARGLAEFSLAHPSVRGVLLDLEMYGFPLWFYTDTCDFGDMAFDLFLSHLPTSPPSPPLEGRGERGGVRAGTPSQIESARTLTSAGASGSRAAERFEWLMEEGLLGRYFEILSEKAEEIGRGLRGAIHDINPNLIIGFYLLNIERSWFYRAFLRGVSTPQRPVIFLSFNMESHRSLRLLEQDQIYVYHASAALMGKFPLSAYDKVLNDAMINGDGYWLNRVTSLVMEGTSGHFSQMESPFELDAEGKPRHFETLAEKQRVIETIGRINHRQDQALEKLTRDA